VLPAEKPLNRPAAEEGGVEPPHSKALRAGHREERRAIRLPRKWFLAKLTNLVWRGRFVAAVVAFRAAGRQALNPIQSFKGVEGSYGN